MKRQIIVRALTPTNHAFVDGIPEHQRLEVQGEAPGVSPLRFYVFQSEHLEVPALSKLAEKIRRYDPGAVVMNLDEGDSFEIFEEVPSAELIEAKKVEDLSKSLAQALTAFVDTLKCITDKRTEPDRFSPVARAEIESIQE